MVWQMIVAVGFGVVFTVKIYWQKIKNFFSRSENENSAGITEIMILPSSSVIHLVFYFSVRESLPSDQ